MIAENKFLLDLYYRLNGIKLVLPPLRNRESDAMILAENFVDDINKESNMDKNYVSKKLNNKALKKINELEWPGNVRELSSLLSKICLIIDNETITDKDISRNLDDVLEKTDSEILNWSIDDKFNLDRKLAEQTIYYIDNAKKDCNKTEAANKLGLNSYQTMDDRYDKAKKTLVATK